MKTLLLILALLMPAEYVSEIEGLRDAITAMISARPTLSDITVLSEKTGDLQNQLALGLATLGACAINMITDMPPSDRQTDRVIIDPLHFEVRVIEDKLLNKTGKSALYIAEQVLKTLKGKTPPVAGAYMILEAKPGIASLKIKSPDPDKDFDENYDVRICHFTTKLALDPTT